MKRYYCTYFDNNYLAQGLVLWESLKKYSNEEFQLFVLCFDNQVFNFFREKELPQITTISIEELEKNDPKFRETKNSRSRSEYFFTSTACWISFLLNTFPEIDLINYVDADIKFYNSPEIIFSEIGDGSVFIIRHNFSSKYKSLLRHGIYNVGFLSIRNDVNGRECLSWWRNRCIEWCYDRVDGEKYADQKYLDKWPSLFKKVVISKNLGLNVAPYNIDNFRIVKKDKSIFINDNQLVFYHYHRLRELSRFLWQLNLFDVDCYSNNVVKGIYYDIIDSIKHIRRKYRLTSKIIDKYRINKKESFVYLKNELKKDYVLIHSLLGIKSINTPGLIGRVAEIRAFFNRKRI